MSSITASPKFTAYVAEIPAGSNHLEIAEKCNAVMREMMTRIGMDGTLLETYVKETYIMWVYSPEYETKFVSMEVYKSFLEKVYGFQFGQDTEATLLARSLDRAQSCRESSTMPDVLDLKFKFGTNPLYKISPEVSAKMRDYTAFLTEAYNQLLTLYATGMKWHIENSKSEVILKYHWLFRFYCSPIHKMFEIFESSIMSTNTIEKAHREYTEQREIYEKLEMVEVTRIASRMSTITCICCPLLMVGAMIAAVIQPCWVAMSLNKEEQKIRRSSKSDTGLTKIIW